MVKNPYKVIHTRYVTEKSSVLSSLHENESNKSVKKCTQHKAVFLVDVNATKTEIANALEEIYKEDNVKVAKVNTVVVKPKVKRVRGRPAKKGKTAFKKKAVVTLAKGSEFSDQTAG